MRLPLQNLSRNFVAVSAIALAIISSAAVAPSVAAQTAPDTTPKPKTPWHGGIDVNGTILYGAANQRVFAVNANTSRLGPKNELRFDMQAGYGDSRNQDTGVRSVIARNVRAGAAYDFLPHGVRSPFALASAESNFQQRYKLRASAGVGMKQTFWRPDSVTDKFPEDLSLSFALLAEHTQLLPDAPVASKASEGTLLRYSLRARFRKRITSKLQFSHVTLYQPSAKDLDRYTLDAQTAIAIPVSNDVKFTITHRERLDSEAVKRGAASIRDGQVLFGVHVSY